MITASIKITLNIFIDLYIKIVLVFLLSNRPFPKLQLLIIGAYGFLIICISSPAYDNYGRYIIL
ncbi:hypothetical protein TH53_21960 [Pedobacter lusitanus]|uniref:Uncharacterized protein n=1 Tax=Pedobacter lusitanus TaxID=1503925 RepID=A0A0D0F0N1_9SPHI|nr:hypothetical protein TH53_21960 [Pedobacter lusitanus]